MNGKKVVCAACGASKMQHPHGLNIPLLQGLIRLRTVAGESPVNIKLLGLTRNQWDNFQKLRYFGLVEKCYNPGGTRAQGVWKLTPLGVLFLDNALTVRARVWTYRGAVVARDGQWLLPGDVIEGYKQPAEWAADAAPWEGTHE